MDKMQDKYDNAKHREKKFSINDTRSMEYQFKKEEVWSSLKQYIKPIPAGLYIKI